MPDVTIEPDDLGIPTRRILRLAAVAVPAAIALSTLLFWLNDQIGTPALLAGGAWPS